MKELIIIIYKINENLPSQYSDYIIENIKNIGLSTDEEIKENYIIREIIIPSDITDINVIYPIPKYTISPEINDLVKEILDKINEDPTNQFKNQWTRLVRELKLRKISSTI